LNQPITEQELLFLKGENYTSYQVFAHQKEVRQDMDGYTFRLWAPNAQEVYLVGDFTEWWEEQIPMEKDEQTGIWSCWTYKAKVGQLYKYKIRQVNGYEAMRIDPFALNYEKRPGAAAIITNQQDKNWQDDEWYSQRRLEDKNKTPHNFYILHAASWKTHDDGSSYKFKDLQEELIPYLSQMNFNAMLFMPLMNHINEESMGYHTTGFFALCPDYGSIEDFQDFVEAAHLAGIAVYMEFPLGQFSRNPDGLGYFDGTPQYEYADRNRGRNQKFSTKNFDLGKKEVQSYLISSAFYWLETFHLDGLRITSVANIIYRNQDGGPWTPNEHGGNENFEGIDFLMKFNRVLHEHYPQVEILAEEATGVQKLTDAVYSGMGFDWNWQNDWYQSIRKFYGMDPIYRKYHYDETLLEVKGLSRQEYSIHPLVEKIKDGTRNTIWNKVFGDTVEEKLAQLKNILVFQKTFPGAPALLMGSELGQMEAFAVGKSLDWAILEDEKHKRFQYFNQRLNELYLNTPAFYQKSFEKGGFEQVDVTSKNETIFSFKRIDDKGESYYIVLNMTPVDYPNYYLGVSEAGVYEEILNSQTFEYGGNAQMLNQSTETRDWDHPNYPYFVRLFLPGYAGLIIRQKP